MWTWLLEENFVVPTVFPFQVRGPALGLHGEVLVYQHFRHLAIIPYRTNNEAQKPF